MACNARKLGNTIGTLPWKWTIHRGNFLNLLKLHRSILSELKIADVISLPLCCLDDGDRRHFGGHFVFFKGNVIRLCTSRDLHPGRRRSILAWLTYSGAWKPVGGRSVLSFWSRHNPTIIRMVPHMRRSIKSYCMVVFFEKEIAIKNSDKKEQKMWAYCLRTIPSDTSSPWMSRSLIWKMQFF